MRTPKLVRLCSVAKCDSIVILHNLKTTKNAKILILNFSINNILYIACLHTRIITKKNETYIIRIFSNCFISSIQQSLHIFLIIRIGFEK